MGVFPHIPQREPGKILSIRPQGLNETDIVARWRDTRADPPSATAGFSICSHTSEATPTSSDLDHETSCRASCPARDWQVVFMNVAGSGTRFGETRSTTGEKTSVTSRLNDAALPLPRRPFPRAYPSLWIRAYHRSAQKETGSGCSADSRPDATET